MFCLALLGILSLVRYFDWMPPLAYSSFWDDPQTNILQLFWPIFAIGLLGGLWAALEMRSREDSSTMVILARALGLILRHGGMLLSAIILLEIIFLVPGMGRLLVKASFQLDVPVVSASAAVFIWLALWSRFLGNLLLAVVDREPTTRPESTGGAINGHGLLIGGGIAIGVLLLLLLLPFVASQDPLMTNRSEVLAGPGGAHWLGTDPIGRDIFSRVLHGGRAAALIALPMGLLAILVGVPMVVARVLLDRAGKSALLYGIEGALEGIVAVPWLVIGILIQVSIGAGWPFLALAVILVPRALRVGWTLGAGETLQLPQLAPMALRLGALFLAAALVMSSALGLLGLGIPLSAADLGGMLSIGSGSIAAVAPWVVIFPGLVLTLVAAIWLVVATLFSRSGPEYRPVGWAHIMS